MNYKDFLIFGVYVIQTRCYMVCYFTGFVSAADHRRLVFGDHQFPSNPFGGNRIKIKSMHENPKK